MVGDENSIPIATISSTSTRKLALLVQSGFTHSMIPNSSKLTLSTKKLLDFTLLPRELPQSMRKVERNTTVELLLPTFPSPPVRLPMDRTVTNKGNLNPKMNALSEGR